MKHMSVCLHHFCPHVVKRMIVIQHVSTTEQHADIFTMPIPNLNKLKHLHDEGVFKKN